MAAMSFLVIASNLAVTVLILFLVLARFVLGWSAVGVLELATLSAVWLYMCGAVIASRNREHLVVDFLAQSITNPRVRSLHALAVSVVMVLVGLFFLKLAYDMVEWSQRRPQTTAALSLPLIIPQAAVVLASILCMGYMIRDLVLALVQVFRNFASDSGGA